jgi:hypothetical protein
MDPAILPTVGLFLLVIGVVAVAFHLENKRKAALQAAAQQLGFTYSLGSIPLSAGPGFAQDLSAMSIRQRGRSNKIDLSLVGTHQGRETALFELSYVTGTKKNRSTHRLLCCAVKVGRQLPKFELRPEGFLDSIGAMIGFDDIDVSSDPEFSKKFHLSGQNPGLITQIFTPTVRRKLLDLEKVELAAAGETIVVYRKTEKLDPKNLSKTLESYSAVARIFL